MLPAMTASDTTSRKRRTGIYHVAVCVDKSRSHGQGILQGVADYVDAEKSWSLFVDPYGDGDLTWQNLGHWQGSGILALLANEKAVFRAAGLKIPIIDVGGIVPQLRLKALGIPSVAHDNTVIGQMAAEHLLDRGCHHFAFSGFAECEWVETRWHGFVKALEETGRDCVRYDYSLPPQTTFAHHESLSRWERAQGRLAKWIEQLPKPVGLMACNDPHAQQVLDACRRADVSVPEDVAVVGVDNDNDYCSLGTPTISSVATDPRKIGYEAAKLLDSLMQRRRAGGTVSDLVQAVRIRPVRVVARGSSSELAVEDEVIAAALRTIFERACEGIKIDSVLEQSGLSRRAFYRRFQKKIGRTPHEQICRVRIERVKALLRDTDLSLERIACKTGYNSASHLSVAFKQDCDTTPGLFRRSLRD